METKQIIYEYIRTHQPQENTVSNMERDLKISKTTIFHHVQLIKKAYKVQNKPF